MNVKPLNEYVQVKRDESETMSVGGLYIPDAHKELAKTGTVMAVGCKVKELKIGDKVLFVWSAGFDIKADGVDYNTELLMKESDVLGVINA